NFSAPHYSHHSFPTRRSSDLVSAGSLDPPSSSTQPIWQPEPQKNSGPCVPDTTTNRREASAAPIRTTSAVNSMPFGPGAGLTYRSEEHTSELQSRENLVCRLL